MDTATSSVAVVRETSTLAHGRACRSVSSAAASCVADSSLRDRDRRRCDISCIESLDMAAVNWARRRAVRVLHCMRNATPRRA